MKKILLITLCFVFMSPAAYSFETFQGCYERLETAEVHQVQRRESVNTLSSEGKEKLALMKSDGYICESKPRSWYLCRKIVDKGVVDPVDVRKKIKNQSLKLCFDQLNEDPVELRKTDYVTVLQYPQVVFRDSSRADEFHLYEWKNHKKIRLQIDGESQDEYVYEKDIQGQSVFKKMEIVTLKSGKGYFSILTSLNYQ